MKKYIDLRSDTVTMPTLAMRTAMMEAEVGDDFYKDDPTVIKLEKMAAEKLGKEAALFVPTGTMGNQLCVMTHTKPGDEMILSKGCHILNSEGGASPRLFGVGYAIADNYDNKIYPEDIKKLVRKKSIYNPTTSLLCLENALSDGSVATVEELRETYRTAKEYDLSVHMDGARIFNAALALGVDAKEIAACADSVMFCVSKGLCAPVGSLVCGTSEFIERARGNRKILGGGMRQAGVIAACGIVALEQMIDRLKDDHDNAKYCGELLAQIPGIEINTNNIQINILFWDTKLEKFDSDIFIDFMLNKGIKVYGYMGNGYRFVTHNGISKADIDYAVDSLKEYLSTLV